VTKRCAVVLDIGKTNAKLTLWDVAGRLLDRASRANALVEGPGYRALDTDGIETWMAETLSRFAAQADIGAIVPVGHGAACALVSDGRLHAVPMDYEDPGDAEARAAYEVERDGFSATGSPNLPQGLNLGWQLDRLERLTGPWPDDLRIVTWPQYWAWRLCGSMACEVTSLGCHSDLWRPLAGRPSALAFDRGWAGRLAPLRRADERLGLVTAEWRGRTGLPADCAVLCGLHDSNAALLAARGHVEIALADATVLSTGTWFVAMRSTAPGQPVDLADLAERRDCLVNVDMAGRPAPSARFMGGREAEILGGIDSFDITRDDVLLDRLPALVAAGVQALPSFAPGVGPFPDAPGRWENAPSDPMDRRAATGLYLALMADTILDLVGSRERLLIEGRFAEAQVFVRALATLRPRQQVFVSHAQDDVPYGALRLLDPDLRPPSPLVRVAPLAVDLADYARTWRQRISEAVVQF
jgi:sugar (pentulose or hexulose) kinase